MGILNLGSDNRAVTKISSWWVYEISGLKTEQLGGSFWLYFHFVSYES